MTVHDVARALPGIAELRDHCRALAMLDAVLSPEWEPRYHSFDAHWGEGEQRASMRDGSGNEYAVVFSPAGAVAEGFDHESPMSPWARVDGDPEVWPGVLDELPAAFHPYVTRPEDEPPSVTACLWRTPDDPAWRTGTIDFPPREGDDAPDGAAYVFELLVDRSPEAYAEWAADYFETEVPVEAVRHVLALRPLTGTVVAALNPALDPAALAKDIAEIGYPEAPGTLLVTAKP